MTICNSILMDMSNKAQTQSADTTRHGNSCETASADPSWRKVSRNHFNLFVKYCGVTCPGICSIPCAHPLPKSPLCASIKVAHFVAHICFRITLVHIRFRDDHFAHTFSESRMVPNVRYFWGLQLFLKPILEICFFGKALSTLLCVCL